MVTKKEMEELNDLLKKEIKDIVYARSKTAMFFIRNGELQQSHKEGKK